MLKKAEFCCIPPSVLSDIKSAKMSTKTAIISIQDLTSEAVLSLRDLLKAAPGVEKVDFSLERSVAVIEFDPLQSDVDSLLRVVLKAGYKVV